MKRLAKSLGKSIGKQIRKDVQKGMADLLDSDPERWHQICLRGYNGPRCQSRAAEIEQRREEMSGKLDLKSAWLYMGGKWRF